MHQPAIIRGELTPDEITILSNGGIIPKDVPPAQVALFAKICQEHGLSPFRNEMSLIKFGGTYQALVRIDGTRKKAARTEQYAGMEDARYNLKSDGTYQTAAELKAANKTPDTCTITVYRMVGGQRCPFTRTVLFAEFATGSNSKWRDTPFQMISKVAESFALKSAFGDELGGLHIQEEAGAFEEHSVAHQTVKVEAAMPEQYQSEFEQACDILNSYANIADVVAFWQQQSDDGPAKMFVTFAKAFFDAAARCSHTPNDLGEFWSATPKKWQQSERLVKVLSTRKTEITNATS